MRRARCRRGRRDPDRDLPGPAASEGRRQRRQAGARQRRQGHPDHRAGDGRDDRDPAGRCRHRRRRDDHPRARRAGDRPQLRHRPARDGRARQMARRQLARADFDPAQCRAARVDQRPHPLPARPEGAGAMARALRARRRGQHHRRLLRHRGSAHRRARPDAAAHRSSQWRWAVPTDAEDPRAGLGPVGRLALQPGEPAPGERVSVDRRALQRQRLARLPPPAGAGRLGRLRRNGARAGQGRLAHARHLHRLCRA